MRPEGPQGSIFTFQLPRHQKALTCPSGALSVASGAIRYKVLPSNRPEAAKQTVAGHPQVPWGMRFKTDHPDPLHQARITAFFHTLVTPIIGFSTRPLRHLHLGTFLLCITPLRARPFSVAGNVFGQSLILRKGSLALAITHKFPAVALPCVLLRGCQQVVISPAR